jgi:hypothetical protein
LELLLCGELASDVPRQQPFPDLETLAIRDFHGTNGCGLDDSIVRRYAAQPSLVTLKRLVLRRCDGFSGDTLVSVIEALHTRAGPDFSSMEMEIWGCSRVHQSHITALEDLGVHVKWVPRMADLVTDIQHMANAWWERRRELATEAWGFADGDWEREGEQARDEIPWWIADVSSRDPGDSWVF